MLIFCTKMITVTVLQVSCMFIILLLLIALQICIRLNLNLLTPSYHSKHQLDANNPKYIFHLVMKHSYSWGFLFCFYLKYLFQGCVHFFQIVMSCVKNVLKNSHAITYQNLFLRNDLVILKISPILKLTNVRFWFCLFCSSSCPVSEGESLWNQSWQHSFSVTHKEVSPYCSLFVHMNNTKDWTGCSGLDLKTTV